MTAITPPAILPPAPAAGLDAPQTEMVFALEALKLLLPRIDQINRNILRMQDAITQLQESVDTLLEQQDEMFGIALDSDENGVPPNRHMKRGTNLET